MQNERYNALMVSGEDLLLKRELEDAKSKITEALTIKPNEPIPAQKLKDTEDLLAQIKAEKQLDADSKAKMEEAEAAYK